MAKLKYKKELKYSQDLEVDDQIKVGGLHCTVMKVESTFYHVPDAQIRLELKIDGSTTKRRDIVLSVPRGVPIVTLK